MIPLRKLRDLTLEKVEGDERSAHVSAASALVHLGRTLFVVADDEKQLSVFPNEGTEPGSQIQILEGPRPVTDEERNERKPDLESLAVLPPSDAFPHGALLTLGSGTKDRNRGALIPLDEARLPADDAVEIDAGPLYAALRDRIEDLNIEGCARRGDTLHLLQRGNDEGGANARVDLSMKAAWEGLEQERALTPGCLQDVTEYDLGRLHGVKLCFSDASELPDGGLVFTCSAETSGEGQDGRVLGSALGIMETDGRVALLEPVDLEVKIEGMTAMMEAGRVRVLLVTDADDPSQPSPLMEAWLPR